MGVIYMTKPFAIIIVVVCTILTSVGQLFWKFASLGFHDVTSVLTSVPLYAGIILYGSGAALLIYALRHGELSVLYPFIALSFIWVSVLSIIFLGESMSWINWGGILLILGGVSSIGRGANHG